MNWSKEQSEFATGLGWDLFTTGRDLQLQRIDFPEDGSEPLFESDLEAAQYVQAQADAGCKISRAAIEALIADQSADLKLHGLRRNWPQ